MAQRKVSSSAAARVDLREMLRVKSVDSYVRNFQGEQHRLQELLEITLCYGLYCVSRNFQLRGMTVDELRTVTKHDQTKAGDFFVRNGASPRGRPAQGTTKDANADPQPVYFKPSRSWRDGNDKSPSADSQDGATSGPRPLVDANTTEVFFLPNEAHKDKLDEIDFYTRVLGKSFVDVAWTTYSSRGSSFLNQDQLEERMVRVDQRKRPDLIPSTEYPVCSFVEFLNAYVKTSVGRSTASPVKAVEFESTEAEPPVPRPPQQPSTVVEPARSKTVASTNSRAGREAVKTQPPRPKSVQHVQSKIQPELRAHRDKLLRVKKTQAQLMRETLARSRLAKYESRRNGDDREASRQQPMAMKRMPLDKITPGAAALEIVDDFIRSPLMDKFASGAPGTEVTATASNRRDPIKEEVYGAAAHDDSFIGCKTPAKPRNLNPSKPKAAATRDYSGWLGDFGPRHTKTVQPTWAADAVEDDDNNNVNDDDDDQDRQPTRAATTKRYEWSFDIPRADRHANASARSVASEGNESASDDWSGRDSAASDPVFRWLKSTAA